MLVPLIVCTSLSPIFVVGHNGCYLELTDPIKHLVSEVKQKLNLKKPGSMDPMVILVYYCFCFLFLKQQKKSSSSRPRQFLTRLPTSLPLTWCRIEDNFHEKTWDPKMLKLLWPSNHLKIGIDGFATLTWRQTLNVWNKKSLIRIIYILIFYNWRY